MQNNVLLIMTDQHRFDCMRCYGNDIIETPNLDWLASEGTLFCNAYSPSPSCIPARACLMTGMTPWNTGILGMGRGQGPMGVGFAHTFPGELAKSGYHTQGVGKMHFFPQRALNGFHNTILDESGRVEEPGFVSDYKRWFDANKTGDYDIIDHGVDWNSWMARPYHAPEFLHPTNWTVNESIRFIRERDPSKPFFLMTSFAKPHSPYDALPYYFDMYINKSIPMPYKGEWASIHDDPIEAMKPNAWRGVRNREEIIRARASYYGLITHVDHQIGRLLMYLRKCGQLDNTIIIFTSDHGDMLGDHNLWRKTYAYEGSAHVPLIVRLPRSFGKRTVSKVYTPVVLQDIMPTILEAVGVEIPATVNGRSLMGLIHGVKEEKDSYIHGEHSTCYSEEQEMQYITDGKWKYIWFPRTGQEQLFNLQVDHGECRNLAEDERYNAEKSRLRRYLVKVLAVRSLGLTEGENLVCQKGRPPIISPKYEKRRQNSGYDWLK